MEDPRGRGQGRLHFAGIAGSGMSALAQYEAMRGRRVSGSDRAFDRGRIERADLRERLERLGITLHPQDGSGVGADCEAVVASTAVEHAVPDLGRARALGVPVLHRSELLATFVAERRTVAVAGTSGKSTVAALVFEALRAAGRDPSVITGAEIRSLQREGLVGNAWVGKGELLVVEADESDGSLVRYEPAIGVVLNVSRDHQEPAEALALFAEICRRTRERVVLGEDDALATLREGAIVFGVGPAAAVRATDVELGRDGSRFTVDGTSFTLSTPGAHNVANALAALAVCRALEVPAAAAASAFAAFAGVARRFETVGRRGGVEVIDDFAHNPSKLDAALATARGRGRRVLAVFQPHGFGPTRFLLEDLAAAFASGLRPEDRLFLLPIFYAGGTARRDVSSEDLAERTRARGAEVETVATRADLATRIAAEAAPGDVVLVLGARDPTLSTLAAEILASCGDGRGLP